MQDVYQYDTLPAPFRVQVIHIWESAIGVHSQPSGGYTGRYDQPSPANEIWKFIHDNLARELGVFALGRERGDPAARCKAFVLEAGTDGALDIIEMSFRVIDRLVRKFSAFEIERAHITQDADDAVEELNRRFQEHAIGFQYCEGILVRLDSQFIHAETVKPAISLLNEAEFEGPAEEFLNAFDHYRHERFKEAVAEALKAFESTMKSICTARKWPFSPTHTAKPLLDTLFKNGLIPAELESSFSGFRSALESGLPTLSNRTSRHGQGVDSKPIPPYLAAYALHLAASNIVLLVQAHTSLP